VHRRYAPGETRSDRRGEPRPNVELYGKLEAANPGGSVKDRIGLAMIEAAERDGLIEPGRTTIVEATSGNTGIALALVCAAKGYELIVTLPQGMSRERTSLLRQYGARVEIVESLGGMSEAVDAARELARSDDVYLPDQFSNPANPQIHRETTAPRSSRRSTGASTRLSPASVPAARSRCREVLRSRNSGCKIVAVEPAASAVLSGGKAGPHHIQGIGAASFRRC